MRLIKSVVVRVASEVFGKDIEPLVERLYGRSDVSEFLLAEELNEDVHTVRNKLYRLHDKHIVTWVKKKDPQKGWYIYYWTLNKQRIKDVSEEAKKDRIEFLQQRLDREKGQLFYICCNRCVRFDFEKATDYEFRCPECDSILMEDNNAKTINHLESEIEKLSADV
jgi:transcription initiation factor TFIIE subunit alpha